MSVVVSGSKTPTYINMSYGRGLKFVNEIGFHNSILSSGFVPVNIKENSKVVNSSFVKYFIKNTVEFPQYENTEEYRNMMKSFIKNYGAIYFTSTAPDIRSGKFYNQEYNMLDVHYDSHKITTAIPSGSKFLGHAMIITGWDDNYGPDDNKDGKPDGAWLIQNSWGEESEVKAFPYISYCSEINSLRGIKIVENKDWDNNYTMASYPVIEYKGEEIEQQKSIFEDLEFSESEEENKLLNVLAVKGVVEATYLKQPSAENLKYINFSSASQNSTYKVYISVNGNKDNYQLIKELKTDMPGLYTIDVENIQLNGDKFAIKIETNDGAVYTQINAFTTNLEGVPEKYDFYDEGFFDKDKYFYHVFIHNPEIQSECSMVIKDKNGKICKVTGNNSGRTRVYAFNNGLTLNVQVPNEIAVGEDIFIEIYNLKNEMIYSTSIKNVPKINMEGKGTKDDPYIIRNPKQFEYMKVNAVYKMVNDIDLSELKDKVAFESDFCGELDGNGYKLLNYKGNNALFNNVIGAKIYNLSLENFDIETNKEYTGILANNITNSQIENVSINGKFKGLSGGIVADVADNTLIKDIYINYDVDGYGIGSVYRKVEKNNVIENVVIDVNLNCNYDVINNLFHGGTVGGIIRQEGENTKVNNVIVSAKVNSVTDTRDIIYYPVSNDSLNMKISNCYQYIEMGEGCKFKIDDRLSKLDGLVINDNYEQLKENAKNILNEFENWNVENNNELPTLKMNHLKELVTYKYEYLEDEKIIANIIPNTEVSCFAENLNLDLTKYDVKVFEDETERRMILEGEVVSTGNVVKIYSFPGNGKPIKEYTLSVLGDLSHDGQLDLTDCTLSCISLVGDSDEVELGTPDWYASDFDKDGKVRLNDVQIMLLYVLKVLFFD